MTDGGQTPEAGSAPESSTKAAMVEVMNKLGEKRQDLGVLSLGTNPDDPNQRVDFFIAPIETESGRSINDGGSMDTVFATPEGFFAIRHSGTVEGKSRFIKLQTDLQRMWGYWHDNKPHQFEGPDNGKFAVEHNGFNFSKDPKRGYSLKFNVPLLYGGENSYTEDGRYGKDETRTIISQIVPIGKEAVNRALEASKEKARELKTGDIYSGVRMHQNREAARSLLGSKELAGNRSRENEEAANSLMDRIRKAGFN